MSRIVLAFLLALPQTDVAIGQKPTMEEFAAVAEPELARRLIAPAEATFVWPYQLVTGPAGYYTCGRVTGRNIQGGRTTIWISAVVANGKVVSAQSEGTNRMLAYLCEKRVKSGEFVLR